MPRYLGCSNSDCSLLLTVSQRSLTGVRRLTAAVVVTNNRNKPCWCGSGLKFKKCHLERELQPRQNPYDAAARQRKLMTFEECLHPAASSSDCRGGIVRAHSIRRSADLLTIAVKSHVQQITADMQTLIKTGGELAPKLVGINNASTFTGFCNHHDTVTFAPLETAPFTASDEQCFLLFYRAWAREHYTKKAALRAIPAMRETDKGESEAAQAATQNWIATYSHGLELGLRDIRTYAAELDAALINRTLGGIQSHIIWFSAPLPILCSGAFFPYWDFDGNRVQTFDETVTPDALSLTLLNEGGRGCAIVSWLRSRSLASARLVQTLQRQVNLSDALCRLAYSCLENVYCDPRWWDGLVESQRNELIARAGHGAQFWKGHSGNFLKSRSALLLSLGVSGSFFSPLLP